MVKLWGMNRSPGPGLVEPPGSDAVTPGTSQPKDRKVMPHTLERDLLTHGGELVTKVGYFGVKSAKVPPGADGHLIC